MSQGEIQREVQVYPDLEALSWAAAKVLVEMIYEAVGRRGQCGLALSGGRTPRRLYELLGSDYAKEIPWDRVHLFWSDERCVPPDHPDSNYRLAHEALIAYAPISSKNVHRVPAELGPRRAAEVYEQILRAFGPLDIALLGVGADGHVASLFPGHPALEERERWVRAIPEPLGSPAHPRVTLTLPALNAAESTFFLAAGAEKRAIIRAILEDLEAAEHYPAARIRPRARAIWYLDREAYETDDTDAG